MVSQVLNRISLFPLKLCPDDGEAQDQIVSTSASQSLIDFTSGNQSKEKAAKGNPVVHAKLSQIINRSLKAFTDFFNGKFACLTELDSVLENCKRADRRELQLIISKILHVFKISSNLSFVRINICEDEHLQQVLTIV